MLILNVPTAAGDDHQRIPQEVFVVLDAELPDWDLACTQKAHPRLRSEDSLGDGDLVLRYSLVEVRRVSIVTKRSVSEVSLADCEVVTI